MNFHSHVRYAIIISLLIILLALGAPIVDIPFHTVATYQAQVSDYQIDIDALGVVHAGDDLTQDGTSRIMISPLKPGPTAVLLFNSTSSGLAAVTIDGKPAGNMNWYSNPQDELRRFLERAGYQNLSIAEVDETVKVIEGAMAGPKATTLPGQSKWLQVVSVQIN